MSSPSDITLKVLANNAVVCMGHSINNLYPLYLQSAKAVVILYTKRTACGYGRLTGDGFLLTKLPATAIGYKGLPAGFVRWSAPIFLKLTGSSFGLLFGRSKSQNWMLSMTDTLLNNLTASPVENGHTLTGLDAACTLGSSDIESSDIIHLSSSSDTRLINMGKAQGCIIGMAFATAKLTIDITKITDVYGASATFDKILTGEIPPPPQMQPVYSMLNEMTTESSSEMMQSISRVSASLEKHTTGIDPDDCMVDGMGRVSMSGISRSSAGSGGAGVSGRVSMSSAI